MNRFLKRYLLWLFYGLFMIVAISYGGREPLLSTTGEYAPGKTIVLLVYVGFVAFSIYATHRESFFRSVGIVNKYLWGRQIGVDLYISVFLSLGLIYFVEGSFLAVIIWAAPIIVFANLAILPYLLLNYSEVVGRLLS